MPFALPLFFAAATATCSLDLAIGVPENDAMAVQEIVCAEARSQNDDASYRVRVSKLGSQYVVRLLNDRGAERHIMVSSLEEVPVAAPRLAMATSTGVTIGETRDVDNVVGGEVRKPKATVARVNAYLGIVGAATIGAEPTAGAMFGIVAGSARWSFVTDLRVTGDAFKSVGMFPVQVATLGLWKPSLDAPSSYGSLAAGMRHHFFASDTSPFVGGGVDVLHTGVRTRVVRDTETEMRDEKKTGLGVWAEAGIDVLRSSTVGGAFVVRFEAPTYTLGSRWRPLGTVAFAMRF